MPKRKSSLDVAQNARRVFEESIGAPLTPKKQDRKSLISQVMSEMGSKGGKIGGKRRAENLSPERKREIASQAARARWGKKKPDTA
jgi:hypothetical protein